MLQDDMTISTVDSDSSPAGTDSAAPSAQPLAGPTLTQLTPLAFLRRSAAVFPDKEAVVYGSRRTTYRELAAETTRLARALRSAGVEPGDRVAYLLPNIPEMVVAHFAVPLAGAVLVTINTRLAPAEILHICDHSGASVLVVDSQLHPLLTKIADRFDTVRQIVTVTDPASGARPDPAIPDIAYEDFLARGSDEPLPWAVEDETATLSINYTSGTTGRPKGVMYHHRGAYLNGLAEIIHQGFSSDTRYLWTLPMFHCNGWCTAWAVAAIGGTQVCLRKPEAGAIWRAIREEGITHLDGAPTILVALAESEDAGPIDGSLVVTTAGAPPSPTIIDRMTALGARIVHVYGLTETYGPYTVCEPQQHWAALPAAERSRIQARQGVGMIVTDGVRVVDHEMRDVPADGVTIGEVVMRGNNVMTGYFRDPAATAQAFQGGWFHSGDLGVMHSDGYIELRDRAKDIVVSGGENISTIEVENALASHPDVIEVAVIGVPDEKWGETPKAFVVVRDGARPTEADLVAHVRTQLAGYKTPRRIEIIDALPKTSTGKIRKFELREREWAGQESRIQG